MKRLSQEGQVPGVRGFLTQLKIDRQKKRRYICLLLILSTLVASGTVWQLRLTGISMTDEATCGIAEHTHTDACYADVLVCGKEEHTHTDACYETRLALTCALEEHVHTEECFDEDGNLICGKEEHTHTDGCYTAERVLVCGKEEHTHTAECYERQLVCGLEEHTHTIMCYSDPAADVETAKDWKATIPERSGVWGADAAAVAESQLGYAESQKNYILSADGSRTMGYTRYGAWYGIPYGDWCAMFVSFCLHYAGVPNSAFPYGSGCYAWMTKLRAAGLYAEAADYTPRTGDVIFLNLSGSAKTDHVGLVTSVEYGADGSAQTVHTVEGNVHDDVSRCEYSAGDTRILGYGALPENPDGPVTVEAAIYTDGGFTQLAEDGAVITVTGVLPDGTEVRAFPVETQIDGEQVLAAYNISLYVPADGGFELYEPEESVTVSIVLPEMAGSGVGVYYVPEDGAPEAVDSTADDGSVSFETNHFSVYAVTADSASLSAMALSTLPAGTYGSRTFSYNNTANAFTSGAYSTYYNASSPLGVAGSFHLVGFGTVTLNSHCNGNILANELEAGANFGTSNLTNELTYVVNYTRVNGNSASSASHILVIGSENTVTSTDNNSALAVNGTKLDKPNTLIQDTDSETAPFIDLDAVESYIRTLSTSLAAKDDSGVTKSTSDMNNMRLTLDSPDGAAFCTLTVAELAAIGGNARNLKMMGFQSSHDGTIIINVDCAGATTITLPNATVWIDGVEQATSETTTFSNGKVIWNFYNAAGVTIETNRMTGMIVAPGATVNIRANLNGTVIAENINVHAESHRTDFTGTIRPAGCVLPSTGGEGVLPYAAAGVGLMLSACLLFIFGKRRKEGRRG